MNNRSKLLADLESLGTRVNRDGTVTLADARNLPIKEAIPRISQKMSADIYFLCRLWQQAAKSIRPGERINSSGEYRDLFVSACAGLSQAAPLPLKTAFAKMALSHTRIDEAAMLRMIDFRLAIDWMREVILQDARRIHLLAMVERPLSKSAQAAGFGRNYDNPSQKAFPWDQYYEDFLENHRADRPNPRRDLSEREKDQKLRSQQGAAMEPDDPHGTVLKAYEDIADGLFDGQHIEGKNEDSLYDMFENNEKWMDHSSDEERPGIDEDKGPLSTRPGRLL